LIVNEYAEDGSFIRQTELSSGEEHTMATETVYVGLTMYMPTWNNMPMSELVTKLKYNLHKVVVTLTETPEQEETQEGVVTEPEEETQDDVLTGPEPEVNEDAEETTPVTERTPIQDVNLCDYTLWCDGAYNEFGEIQVRGGYFSTAECHGVQGAGRYAVTLGDGRFRLIDNEYAEDGSFLRQTELSSGAEHEMTKETAYAGLTMYMPIWKDMPMSELVTKLKYNLHKVVVAQQ
jgi:hypothetical protein